MKLKYKKEKIKIKLNAEEKTCLKKIIDEMSQCGLFCGRYDAAHGKEDFMYGILTTMEYLAGFISYEYCENYSDMFIKNMLESEKKALTNTVK